MAPVNVKETVKAPVNVKETGKETVLTKENEQFQRAKNAQAKNAREDKVQTRSSMRKMPITNCSDASSDHVVQPDACMPTNFPTLMIDAYYNGGIPDLLKKMAQKFPSVNCFGVPRWLPVYILYLKKNPNQFPKGLNGFLSVYCESICSQRPTQSQPSLKQK